MLTADAREETDEFEICNDKDGIEFIDCETRNLERLRSEKELRLLELKGNKVEEIGVESEYNLISEQKEEDIESDEEDIEPDEEEIQQSEITIQRLHEMVEPEC